MRDQTNQNHGLRKSISRCQLNRLWIVFLILELTVVAAGEVRIRAIFAAIPKNNFIDE